MTIRLAIVAVVVVVRGRRGTATETRHDLIGVIVIVFSTEIPLRIHRLYSLWIIDTVVVISVLQLAVVATVEGRRFVAEFAFGYHEQHGVVIVAIVMLAQITWQSNLRLLSLWGSIHMTLFMN